MGDKALRLWEETVEERGVLSHGLRLVVALHSLDQTRAGVANFSPLTPVTGTMVVSLPVSGA